MKIDELRPGDYYQDDLYRPCLCVSVDASIDEIVGICLIDGSYPCSCGARIGGELVKKLTFEEAMQLLFFGPVDLPASEWPSWVQNTGNPPAWLKPPL